MMIIIQIITQEQSKIYSSIHYNGCRAQIIQMAEYYIPNVLGCSSKHIIFIEAVLHVLCSFLTQFLEVTQFNFQSLWSLAVGDSKTIPQRYYYFFFKGSFALRTRFLGYQHHKHMCHSKHFLPAILRQHFWNLSRVYLLLKEKPDKVREHLSELQMEGWLFVGKETTAALMGTEKQNGIRSHRFKCDSVPASHTHPKSQQS